MNNFTPQENNLLLYLECCAVDYGGKIDSRRINDDERHILKRWHSNKFIQYGRIAANDIRGGLTHWVTFTDSAWTAAHNERRARNARMMNQRRAEYIGYEVTQ